MMNKNNNSSAGVQDPTRVSSATVIGLLFARELQTVKRDIRLSNQSICRQSKSLATLVLSNRLQGPLESDEEVQSGRMCHAQPDMCCVLNLNGDPL
jgi:hypothetical protein